MRVSRAWRDIAARIQAGYGHHPEEQITPGALAIFCPACPQPGINLPDDWENDEQRWVPNQSPPCPLLTPILAGYTTGAL